MLIGWLDGCIHPSIHPSHSHSSPSVQFQFYFILPLPSCRWTPSQKAKVRRWARLAHVFDAFHAVAIKWLLVSFTSWNTLCVIIVMQSPLCWRSSSVLNGDGSVSDSQLFSEMTYECGIILLLPSCRWTRSQKAKVWLICSCTNNHCLMLFFFFFTAWIKSITLWVTSDLCQQRHWLVMLLYVSQVGYEWYLHKWCKMIWYSLYENWTTWIKFHET